MNSEKCRVIDNLIQKMCEKNSELEESARRALMGYMKFQLKRKNAKLYDYTKIDLKLFAKSLGLKDAPRVRAISRREKRKENK